MNRIFKAALPCALVTWAACGAYGQATNPRGLGRPPASRGVRDVGPGAAQGQPAGGQAAEAGGPEMDGAGGGRSRAGVDPAIAARKMDELLTLWEQRSSEIKTLDAKFVREDVAKAWQQKTTYVGRAILKSPDLAFLDFRKVEDNGKRSVPYEQIRCTGKDVYQYRSSTNQIFIYPLSKEQRQRALEEGPLPFLFNMRAKEAKQRYYLTLANESLTHYVINITPRQQIDRDAFTTATVLLSKEKFLPEAIRLYVPPDGKDTQTYRFSGAGTFIKTNVEVNQQNFEGRVLENWDVVYNPGPDGRPQTNAAPAPQPGARRPALNRPGRSAPSRR